MRRIIGAFIGEEKEVAGEDCYGYYKCKFKHTSGNEFDLLTFENPPKNIPVIVIPCGYDNKETCDVCEYDVVH